MIDPEGAPGGDRNFIIEASHFEKELRPRPNRRHDISIHRHRGHVAADGADSSGGGDGGEQPRSARGEAQHGHQEKRFHGRTACQVPWPENPCCCPDHLPLAVAFPLASTAKVPVKE